MPSVRIRARAKQDLVDLAEYIANDNLDAAERFINAAQHAIEFLSKTPGAGSIREYFTPELRELRTWPIRGFENYLIFYRELPQGVDIVRVIHGARDIPTIFEDNEI